MFDTLIVQPIFNLLVLIYALLPGHNFGVAIILFTVVVRMLMWPLVKKQLHHAKAMRELQPELKRIKKEAKGDRQKESAMTMALYKEKEINPFASVGLLIVQIPILIALYSGINRIIKDPETIISFAYPFVQKIGNLPELAANIGSFDSTFLGFIDLTKAALVPGGGVYWPAMFLVIASAVVQYYQSKQLMPNDKDARKLSQILKEAGSGKSADQSEVNSAVGRSTRFFIPAMIFIFTVNLPSALSLYWVTSGLIALLQQRRILGQGEKELEESSVDGKPTAKQRAKKAVEAEVVTKPVSKAKPAPRKRKASKKKKGRK